MKPQKPTPQTLPHSRARAVALAAALLAAPALAGCTADAPAEATAARPAAATPTAAPTAAADAERERVRAALDEFFAAAERYDWGVIDGLLAEDFTFYSDDTLTLTRRQFLDAMRGDEMVIEELRLDDVSVELSGDGGLAVVKYRAALESSIQGEPYDMESIETVIFRKEGTDWRMTHNHASIRRL